MKIGSPDGRPREAVARSVPTDIPVAAICASDGSLEATRRLLSEIPADSGLAFVILYLGLASESLLPQLAGGRTKLQMRIAKNGILLMPNHAYIVPPETYLSISSGSLRFGAPPLGKHAQMPFDYLLYSLAADRGARGIGILISDAGTDGADGLKALKKAGGLTIVRDPKEVKREGQVSDAVNGHSVAEGLELSPFVERLRSHTAKDLGSYKPEAPRQRIERPAPLATGRDFNSVYHFGETGPGQVRRRAPTSAAERASRENSRFLAVASHDLRQPLQTICLLHGLLKERVADPMARATLTKLEGAVDSMTELLDILLDIDQLDAGGVTPELSDFPLSSLLDGAAADLAPVAMARGLKLRTVSSSVSIHSDHRLLARMIGNLLANAIKYTDHGKVLLGCRRRGDTLRIEVRNTGIGIPSESFSAVFKDSYWTDRTSATEFGLGLGLYIVHRFAQLLGYGMEMHSEPDSGTAFAIVIPGVDFGATAPKGNDANKETWPEPTILLIEDDAAQLDTLRTLLELESYRVVAVRSGSEALAQLHVPPVVRPNLIMVDCNLSGGMTGLEIIRRVRDELGGDVPGLIVSAEGPFEALEASNGNNIVVIPRPVKPANLISTIDALVENAFPRLRWTNPPPEQMVILSSASVSAPDIAIIDDEPGIRDAFRAILEAERYTVETFVSAAAFLSDPGHARFRCLIVDLMLPGVDGLQLQSRLRAEQLGAPIIFVTGQSNLPIAVKAMREGATDFLQKPVHAETLRETVVRALQHGDQTVNHRIEQENVAGRIATLTTRERQVMEHVLAGHLNKNIAAELGISRRTTEHHRQSVFRKMGTKSLATLVRMVEQTRGK